MGRKLRYREGEHLHVLNATSFLTEVSFCFPSLFPLLSASSYLEVRLDLSMTLTGHVGIRISLTGLQWISKEMKECMYKLSAPCLHRGNSQWTSGLVSPMELILEPGWDGQAKGVKFQRPCWCRQLKICVLYHNYSLVLLFPLWSAVDQSQYYQHHLSEGKQLSSLANLSSFLYPTIPFCHGTNAFC